MRDLAVQQGIAPDVAWLYPAIIDGAIIVFSLSVVQVSLAGERPRYPWVLVGVFTALSVMLNILHAAATLLPKLMAAIPPVALFLSFELLMNQIKWAAKRQSLGQTVAELETAIATLQAERSRLEEEIPAAPTALKSKHEALRVAGLRLSQREETNTTRENPDVLPAGLKGGKTSKTDKAEVQRGRVFRPKVNDQRTEVKDENQAQLLAYLLTHPQANPRDIAEAMGDVPEARFSVISRNSRLRAHWPGEMMAGRTFNPYRPAQKPITQPKTRSKTMMNPFYPSSHNNPVQPHGEPTLPTAWTFLLVYHLLVYLAYALVWLWTRGFELFWLGAAAFFLALFVLTSHWLYRMVSQVTSHKRKAVLGD